MEGALFTDPFLGGEYVESATKFLTLCDYCSAHSHTQQITYQLGKSVGRVWKEAIHQFDIDILKPCTYVNDTVINFWMLWITRYDVGDSSTVLMLNSHFYNKLCDTGVESVRRWSNRVDLMNIKWILVPVNLNLHWSLCVVYQPGLIKSVSGPKLDTEMPCILHMDSLHCSRTISSNIRNWLNYLWKSKG